MHEVAPNEVLDLATLNLTVMRYCITRHIRMSFPKIGAHFSQIILNSFCYLLFLKLFQHNLQRPSPGYNQFRRGQAVMR